MYERRINYAAYSDSIRAAFIEGQIDSEEKEMVEDIVFRGGRPAQKYPVPDDRNYKEFCEQFKGRNEVVYNLLRNFGEDYLRFLYFEL